MLWFQLNPGDHWIDLTKSNGAWSYGDGSLVIPELWAPNQPDGSADCGTTIWYLGTLYLDDVTCCLNYYYICEGFVIVWVIELIYIYLISCMFPSCITHTHPVKLWINYLCTYLHSLKPWTDSNMFTCFNNKTL